MKILILLAAPIALFAQSGALMPYARQSPLDNNGHTLAGSCVYSYAAGGTTPLNTYSNSGLTIANTNPMVVDGNGRLPPVYMTPVAYKFIFAQKVLNACPGSPGTTIWSQDNVYDFAQLFKVILAGPTGATLIGYQYPSGTARTVANRLQDVISVKDFGATGDGSHNDTAAIQAAVNVACAIAAGGGSTYGASVYFPLPPAFYNVPSSVTLCARLELAGAMASIVFSGTGALFIIPASNLGSIHGFRLFGSAAANTWAIKCAGTGGSGCISEHIYDNFITNFGDAATASGGGIWIANNSEKIEVNSNGIYNWGNGIQCDNGCGDQATIHDNKIQDLGVTSSTPGDAGNTAKSTCVVISGTTGTAKQMVFNNNFVCNGAVRYSGTGSATIEGNEAESFQTVSNASDAIYEVLGGTSTAFVTVRNNYANMHNLSKRGFYITSATATSYISENNCVPMQTGGGQVQYCIYNGNANSTTFYQNNGIYLPHPNARLYEFPNDPGVINTPPVSYAQTDSASLVRAASATYATPNTLSAASWAANVATYTCVGCDVRTGQVIEIAAAVPSTWNINKGQCFATYISVDQFSCPLTYDPGTWSSGGAVSVLRTSTLSYGDWTFNPYDTGTTLLRKNAGSANAEKWSHNVQNSAANDAMSIGESSSTYATGGSLGWLPNSATFIYFPAKYRLGTGTGATPVMLSDGVGKTGFGGIPVYANNAAAIVGGLTTGMFYRTGADPDPVMVVH